VGKIKTGRNLPIAILVGLILIRKIQEKKNQKGKSKSIK